MEARCFDEQLVITRQRLRNQCPAINPDTLRLRHDHDAGSAGALALLPVELQHEVMAWLDVESLFVFGNLNRQTASMLTAMTALTKVGITDGSQLKADRC